MVSERFPTPLHCRKEAFASETQRGEQHWMATPCRVPPHTEANLHRYTALPPLVKAAGKNCGVYAGPHCGWPTVGLKNQKRVLQTEESKMVCFPQPRSVSRPDIIIVPRCTCPVQRKSGNSIAFKNLILI